MKGIREGLTPFLIQRSWTVIESLSLVLEHRFCGRRKCILILIYEGEDENVNEKCGRIRILPPQELYSPLTMRIPSRHIQGLIISVSAVLILSPDALIISLIATDRWTLIFWRGLLTGLALLLFLWLTNGKTLAARIREMGRPGIMVTLLFSVSTITFVNSVILTTAANTLVIIAAAPLFAAFFSRAFLGEIIPLRTWVAVTAGFAGVAILLGSSLGGGALLGDLLALVTAFLLAVNLVIIRRSRSVSMIPATAFSGLLTAAVLLPLASPLSPSGSDFLLLVILGAFILPIALGLLTLAPRYLPAPEVSLILLLETVLGPYWVWMVLGEVPAAATFMGGALVLCSIVFNSALGLWAVRRSPLS